MSINKVILLGHLGNDPETKHFDKGQITRISLATTETYINQRNEKVTDTEWHTVIFRNKTAEVVEKHLKKGSKISVEGKIKTRSYEQDGDKRYITEVIADSFTFEDNKQ